MQITIDFTSRTRDGGPGRFDKMGNRVLLASSHPRVNPILGNRQKLIELARELSDSNGEFNFCIGHPFRT